jgi:hypothetical protein
LHIFICVLIFRTVLEKGRDIVYDSLQIALGLLELPCLLVERCFVVERGDDKLSFDGLATTGSIFKHFLGFSQVNERLSVLQFLYVETAVVVEFLEFLIEFLCIMANVQSL